MTEMTFAERHAIKSHMAATILAGMVSGLPLNIRLEQSEIDRYTDRAVRFTESILARTMENS